MRLNILIPHLHPILVNFLDMDTLDNLHTLFLQLLLNFLGKFWAKRCLDSIWALHEYETGIPRSDALEVSRQDMIDMHGRSCCKLNPRWASADKHEGEQAFALLLV